MRKLIVLIWVVLLSGIYTSCTKTQAFEASEGEKGCSINALTREQTADLLYSRNLDSIQFIDIRNAHDFSVSHLPNAINIPRNNFLNKKYHKKIDKDKILIVYGYNSSEPRLISLLASHYKIANLYVILGGYDYLKNNIIDNFGIYSGIYNDEEPLCDYAKKMIDVASKAGAASSKPTSGVKAAPVPMVKRKKKEVSGGCG